MDSESFNDEVKKRGLCCQVNKDDINRYITFTFFKPNTFLRIVKHIDYSDTCNDFVFDLRIKEILEEVDEELDH